MSGLLLRIICCGALAGATLIAFSPAVAQEWPSELRTFRKSLASENAAERREARKQFTTQLADIDEPKRSTVIANLVQSLPSEDYLIQLGVTIALSQQPAPWNADNLEKHTATLYRLFLKNKDETLKRSIDDALANAKGLYRDGINNFNSMSLASLAGAEPKLRAMAQAFPMSRYAERAAFYLAQYYSKRFVLKDPAGKALIGTSNIEYENYINRTQKKEFGSDTLLAGGYFFRALNGWLVGNVSDARSWLSKGQERFNDRQHQVYVYQLFPSTDRALVIDQYLPARTAFTKTLEFLGQSPVPSVDRVFDLAKILRQAGAKASE